MYFTPVIGTSLSPKLIFYCFATSHTHHQENKDCCDYLHHRTDQQTSESSKGPFPWRRGERLLTPAPVPGFLYSMCTREPWTAFVGWFCWTQEGWYEETPPLLPHPITYHHQLKPSTALLTSGQRTASLYTALEDYTKNTQTIKPKCSWRLFYWSKPNSFQKIKNTC